MIQLREYGVRQDQGRSSGNEEKWKGSPRMLRVELRGLAEGLGREGEAGKERS